MQKDPVNYEILPLDSGADSFITVEWDYKWGKIIGFEHNNEGLHELMRVMSAVAESFIIELKDEWMISKPSVSVSLTAPKAYVKIAMRKKEFYKEIQNANSEKRDAPIQAD